MWKNKKQVIRPNFNFRTSLVTYFIIISNLFITICIIHYFMTHSWYSIKYFTYTWDQTLSTEHSLSCKAYRIIICIINTQVFIYNQWYYYHWKPNILSYPEIYSLLDILLLISESSTMTWWYIIISWILSKQRCVLQTGVDPMCMDIWLF